MMTVCFIIIGVVTGAFFGPTPWHNFFIHLCLGLLSTHCFDLFDANLIDGLATGMFTGLAGFYLDLQIFMLIRKKNDMDRGLNNRI